MKRAEIQAILASAGQGPRHQFGQNFMVDENILGAIADAGEIDAEDVILEVGPGVGNLTRLLAQRARSVLAVELDATLMAAARRHHAGLTNVTWIEADVLAGKHEIMPGVVEKLRDLAGGRGVKLVSNLPYNAASPLVAELLVLMWAERGRADGVKFSRMAFTVQWEVGQRMAAVPGTGDFGPLGILIQLMAEVRIVRKIPAGAFWPAPKVQSALVVVMPEWERMGRIGDAKGLQRMLAGVFGHRRQKVSNGLRHYLGEGSTAQVAEKLADAGIDLTLRPEMLKAEQFLVMAEICGGMGEGEDEM